MLRDISRRGAVVALVVLLLGLCNKTNSTTGEPMLDGADEMGLIGSMRYQTNVVPTQKNQFIRDQVVANENDPTMALNLQAKMKREAPAKQAATPAPAFAPDAAAPSARAAASPQQTAPNKSEGGSTSAATIGDRLKKRANRVGEVIPAHIPMRLRRHQVQSASHLEQAANGGSGRDNGFNASSGYRPSSGLNANGGPNENTAGSSRGSGGKVAELGEKPSLARHMVQSVRERCSEGYKPQGEQSVGPASQERAASDGVSKLDELSEKLRNRTNEARQLVGSIRQQCAESLGSAPSIKQADIASRLRRQAPQIGGAINQQPNPVDAASASLAALTGAVRNQAGAAIQQFQTFRDQLVGSAAPIIDQSVPKRSRRQITHVSGSGPVLPSGTNGGSSSGGIMKYLSDLGQQANQAQAISQFLSAAGASGSQGTASQPGSSGGFELAKLMSQLTDLIRSTQDRNARVLETTQRSAEATAQQAVEAAKNIQGGAQSALGELGQGLQRLASNNPNLLPDIKNLYQTLASRLSSATSSATQAVQANQQQLNLPVAQ